MRMLIVKIGHFRQFTLGINCLAHIYPEEARLEKFFFTQHSRAKHSGVVFDEVKYPREA